MLTSDFLIINNKGEINNNMVNTLKMCSITYDQIKKFGKVPQILYSYSQNDVKDKDKFKDQVLNIKQEVIENCESLTIERTADELFSYNEDRIRVFG